MGISKAIITMTHPTYFFWQLVQAARAHTSSPYQVEKAMIQTFLGYTGEKEVRYLESQYCQNCKNQCIPIWVRDAIAQVHKICTVCLGYFPES